MRIAVLGRTHMLLHAAQALHAAGHEIPLVGTSPADPFYEADENDFEAFARSVDADFFCSTGINRTDIVERLLKSRCRVAVSLNWVSMIKHEACAAFPDGILNVHPGDLPRYRGNACPNWAILQGESYVGTAVHRIDPDGLDNGPILVRARYALTQDTYIGEVYDWLDREVPVLLLEAARLLEEGTARFEEQSSNPEAWLRCYPRRPEDSRITWNQSAEMIHRLIRASSHPLAGAHSTLEGQRKVIVWRAEPVEHQGEFLAIPGQVLYRQGTDPVIACGKDCLHLHDVTVEGCLSSDEAKNVISGSFRNRLI